MSFDDDFKSRAAPGGPSPTPPAALDPNWGARGSTGLTVLVVDDEPTQRDTIRRGLVLFGHRTLAVETGEEVVVERLVPAPLDAADRPSPIVAQAVDLDRAQVDAVEEEVPGALGARVRVAETQPPDRRAMEPDQPLSVWPELAREGLAAHLLDGQLAGRVGEHLGRWAEADRLGPREVDRVGGARRAGEEEQDHAGREPAREGSAHQRIGPPLWSTPFWSS